MRRGGAYDRFLMMLEAFLERGCEVHCLSLTPIQINHPSFHNHKIYFPFKKADGMMAKFWVLSFFPTWALWIGWRNRIDLIIAFGSLYAFIQSLSKYFLKIPMVTFIRGSLTFGSKIQNSNKWFLCFIKRIEIIGLYISDRIIANNMSVREEILRKFGKKKKIDVQVLYNNIPPMDIREPEDISQTRDKYGIPKSAKVLITSGIINKGKNLDILIKCITKIGLEKIHLLIIGDGSTETDFSYKGYLISLVRKLKVDHQVSFTGWLKKEEVWKIYHTSDLFLLLSLNEGMPNAMLEALGVGLACMGSNIPGIKDILQYEDLMFDPLEEESLLQKIQGFFSDKQFFDKVKILCQERKDIFVFDWKERVFEMITGAPTSLIK